jgi:hypothetical protein
LTTPFSRAELNISFFFCVLAHDTALFAFEVRVKIDSLEGSGLDNISHDKYLSVDVRSVQRRGEEKVAVETIIESNFISL